MREHLWQVLTFAATFFGPTIGFIFGRMYESATTPSDVTKRALRLLKVFNKASGGDPRTYLDVREVAETAGLDEYEFELQQLVQLRYLERSNLPGDVVFWITPEGMRRAGRK